MEAGRRVRVVRVRLAELEAGEGGRAERGQEDASRGTYGSLRSVSCAKLHLPSLLLCSPDASPTVRKPPLA